MLVFAILLGLAYGECRQGCILYAVRCCHFVDQPTQWRDAMVCRIWRICHFFCHSRHIWHGAPVSVGRWEQHSPQQLHLPWHWPRYASLYRNSGEEPILCLYIDPTTTNSSCCPVEPSVHIARRCRQCDAVNGLAVSNTWTLRASLLTYFMALTATIGKKLARVGGSYQHMAHA
jgi:hypothetical protein